MADGFFFAETFFADGFETFLAGAGFAFFMGFFDFTEDLLFFTAMFFLDGLTEFFLVLFSVVSFFTISTSSEN